MSRLIRTVIEVERKFKPDADFMRRLEANRGPPPFRDVRFLGKRSFEDTYFDRDGSLSARGIWVRRRSGAWQAKARCGGTSSSSNNDFRNSQFLEYDKVKDIRHLVEKHAKPATTGNDDDDDDAGNAFGLSPIAHFATLRRAWRVDGDNDSDDSGFEVVLDETDFGHTVGEVELQRECELQQREDGSREDGEAARRMDIEIAVFMKKYAWAFPNDNPVGKLSAYFKYEARRDVLRN